MRRWPASAGSDAAPRGQCTERFVSMFANQDSVGMPADVREGLRVLFAEAIDLGLVHSLPPLDIVAGAAVPEARVA